MKLSLLFCFAVCFVQTDKLFAQTTYQLPPNQLEQDACNALELCGNSFFTPYSYTSTGRKKDLDSTPCLLGGGGGEVNSVWLRLHTAATGNIVFTITPVDKNDDYDFAVVDITGKNCSSISSKDVTRCNYNNNQPNSNINGIIGLKNDTTRKSYVPKETFGQSFSQAVFARDGGDYLIMINNYGNYVSGGASKGFTIDFTGSTTSFYSPTAPELQSIDEVCNDNSSIIIKTSSEVLCNSIAADGSDFITTAPARIVSASGINCTDRGGYTRSILIHFDALLSAGNYTINLKKGSNNNTITGLCNNKALSFGSLPFIIKPRSKVAIENESICFQQLPYAWNGKLLTSGGDSVATYVTSSVAGCDSFTILNLKVSGPPKEVNLSASICDGDSYILPWNATATKAGTYTRHYTNDNGCDSVIENVIITVYTPPGGNVQDRDSTIQTGFCQGGSVSLDGSNKFMSYLWNTGQTTSSIIVKIAGSYGLEAKDNYGCTTIDTFVVAAYQRPSANFNGIENLCADSTTILDGGDGYVSYLWNNGSTNQTVTIDKPGTFWVRLTSTRNCTGIDTVHVVRVERPSDFLTGSLTKCALKNAMLSPVSNFSRYIWSNGTNTRQTSVSSGGLYTLTVTDYNGCTGRDSIRVIDSICPIYFYMPTAFTPNYDGHNDLFRPIFSGAIAGYYFAIYNRWGQLIFSTRDAMRGWDGTINGNQQSIGSYMWLCSYSLDGQSIRTDRGTVTLLR